MFEAAAEVSASTGSKVWGIGVDQDQYLTIGGAIPEVQEYILTSMVKKVEVAVYNVGGNVRFGIHETTSRVFFNV